MIKIIPQKTIYFLIIFGFIIPYQTQTALANDNDNYNPCDGDSTQEMVECLVLDYERYERRIQRIINTQKNKISKKKFAELQKFHEHWGNSVSEYCGYQTFNPGSIFRINRAYCKNDAWRKRIKSIKADLKIFKNPDNTTQQKAKIAYLKEAKKLTQNVQKVMNKIDKQTTNYPEFSELLERYKESKKIYYKNHISYWKDYAATYCSYQGTNFVCLNNLYKAKNKMVIKDYKNYVKIP